MITRTQFDAWMHKTLESEKNEAFLKKDVLHNGLQTYGAERIRRVGFGVSASMQLFQLAKREYCDAVVVHHGINIAPRNPDRLSYERLAFLIKSNLSLWSGHFLLDAHPRLGNNVQILKAIGAKPEKPYMHRDMPWGWHGEFAKPKAFSQILKAIERSVSPFAIYYQFGPNNIQRVVAVSGAGAPQSDEMDALMHERVDLFITGEVNEWNREFFREAQINFLAAGHYHTEVFGLQALQKWMEKELEVKTVWLDLQNEV